VKRRLRAAAKEISDKVGGVDRSIKHVKHKVERHAREAVKVEAKRKVETETEKEKAADDAQVERQREAAEREKSKTTKLKEKVSKMEHQNLRLKKKAVLALQVARDARKKKAVLALQVARDARKKKAVLALQVSRDVRKKAQHMPQPQAERAQRAHWEGKVRQQAQQQAKRQSQMKASRTLSKPHTSQHRQSKTKHTTKHKALSYPEEVKKLLHMDTTETHAAYARITTGPGPAPKLGDKHTSTLSSSHAHKHLAATSHAKHHKHGLQSYSAEVKKLLDMGTEKTHSAFSSIRK